MSLSSELISQFAKITNDEKPKKSEEVTLYGEVVELEEMICVRFDGAEELTPVTTIVEKDDTGEIVNYKYGAASVKSGDRVSVSLKNHSATITGNLSDPPAGRAEFKVNEDSILARVGATEMWIKKEGVTFKGLSEGTTVIDGGCIKTGTIDAKYLKLTGAISFGDLKDSATVQSTIDGAVSDASNALSTANGAASTASSALSTANSAANRATSAQSIAKSIANGSYLEGTFINGKKISSPEIEGNNIKVYGTFQTIGNDGVSQITTGYMGAAMGKDYYGNDTIGVALSNSWDSSDGSIGTNYVIVTNAGARIQSGNNRVIVTDDGIYLRTAGSSKAYYNGKEIGSGSATTVTAVWG